MTISQRSVVMLTTVDESGPGQYNAEKRCILDVKATVTIDRRTVKTSTRHQRL
jgi:hypothetical protein